MNAGTNASFRMKLVGWANPEELPILHRSLAAAISRILGRHWRTWLFILPVLAILFVLASLQSFLLFLLAVLLDGARWLVGLADEVPLSREWHARRAEAESRASMEKVEIHLTQMAIPDLISRTMSHEKYEARDQLHLRPPTNKFLVFRVPSADAKRWTSALQEAIQYAEFIDQNRRKAAWIISRADHGRGRMCCGRPCGRPKPNTAGSQRYLAMVAAATRPFGSIASFFSNMLGIPTSVAVPSIKADATSFDNPMRHAANGRGGAGPKGRGPRAPHAQGQGDSEESHVPYLTVLRDQPGPPSRELLGDILGELQELRRDHGDMQRWRQHMGDMDPAAGDSLTKIVDSMNGTAHRVHMALVVGREHPSAPLTSYEFEAAVTDAKLPPEPTSALGNINGFKLTFLLGQTVDPATKAQRTAADQCRVAYAALYRGAILNAVDVAGFKAVAAFSNFSAYFYLSGGLTAFMQPSVLQHIGNVNEKGDCPLSFLTPVDKVKVHDFDRHDRQLDALRAYSELTTTGWMPVHARATDAEGNPACAHIPSGLKGHLVPTALGQPKWCPHATCNCMPHAGGLYQQVVDVCLALCHYVLELDNGGSATLFRHSHGVADKDFWTLMYATQVILVLMVKTNLRAWWPFVAAGGVDLLCRIQEKVRYTYAISCGIQDQTGDWMKSEARFQALLALLYTKEAPTSSPPASEFDEDGVPVPDNSLHGYLTALNFVPDMIGTDRDLPDEVRAFFHGCPKDLDDSALQQAMEANANNDKKKDAKPIGEAMIVAAAGDALSNAAEGDDNDVTPDGGPPTAAEFIAKTVDQILQQHSLSKRREEAESSNAATGAAFGNIAPGTDAGATTPAPSAPKTPRSGGHVPKPRIRCPSIKIILTTIASTVLSWLALLPVVDLISWEVIRDHCQVLALVMDVYARPVMAQARDKLSIIVKAPSFDIPLVFSLAIPDHWIIVLQVLLVLVVLFVFWSFWWEHP